MTSHHPPPMSRWLLRVAGRRLGLPDLSPDADQIFQVRCAEHGRRAGCRWYRGEARKAVWQVMLATTRVARRPALAGLSLDARLGFRMLRKYPGLTLVGGLAMAFAIFVGAVLFEFIRQTLPGPDLPIPHAHQVVGLRLWDRARSTAVRFTGDQLAYWQRTLTSMELVGGFSDGARPVSTAAGLARVEQVAVMSPSGFALADARPLLGRVYTDRDLADGTTAMAVISAATWKELFAGSPDVLGQELLVGDQWVQVIGVLPDGVKFPVSHTLWLPLDPRTDGAAPLRLFGRLRTSVTVEQAEAEMLALMGDMPARQPPDPQVRPMVQTYRASLFDAPLTLRLRVLVQQLNAFAALFLMLVAANIALLMFARAATRERELVVRGALGASRRRIVAQFLTEALVLFAGAAALGLAATGPGLRWVEYKIASMGGGSSPFWFASAVSFDTMVYAGLLTLAAALITGGLPAFRATRQLSASRLQESGSAAGRLRLGGVWTVVVVTQVAATVIFTAGALLMWRQARLSGSLDASFVPTEYVDVLIGGRADLAAPDRFARVGGAVADLAQVAGVVDVTMADRLPLMTHGAMRVEVEGEAAAIDVSMPRVDTGFFDTFQAPILAGRPFLDVDRSTATGVIVDQAFAAEALGGRGAVGRRLRVVPPDVTTPPGPWLEIVGVVRSLEPASSRRLYLDNQRRPVVYRLLEPAQFPQLVHLAVRTSRSDVDVLVALRQRLQRHAPELMVHEVQTLDRAASAESAFWRFWAELVFITSVVTLGLALAGIYAVMSFTVTRRTREIGIRMALGARGSRVALEVLRSPLRQVVMGIVFGCLVVSGLYWTVTGHVAHVELGALAMFALGIAMVCGLACLEPARRALRVQPSRSLGDHG